MHDKYYTDNKSTCSLVDLFLFIINRTKCCSDYHHWPCGTCLPTSTTTTERSPSLATAATTAAATTTATAATTTQTATGSINLSNYLIAQNDTRWFNFFHNSFLQQQQLEEQLRQQKVFWIRFHCQQKVPNLSPEQKIWIPRI